MKRPDSDSAVPISPFLKWAGGKRWLVDRYPDFFEVAFDRFIEPFLGSGAVYFKLAPKKALLSDINTDLIETYSEVRQRAPEVVRRLKSHHRQHSVEHYYAVRMGRPAGPAARAANFIYLNRTCWNGLYRVNRKGVFNVPIGSKPGALLKTDCFDRVASLLSSAKLYACDFSKTLARARAGDFVFIDPPYTVKHNNNGFIKYNDGLFSWRDQIRLRDAVSTAVARGAKVLVTNADHRCVRELYRGMGEHHRVKRKSVIAGVSASRGISGELVIKCF